MSLAVERSQNTIPLGTSSRIDSFEMNPYHPSHISGESQMKTHTRLQTSSNQRRTLSMRGIALTLLSPLLLLLLGATVDATAQRASKIYPTVLYPGENVISVKASEGIQNVRVMPMNSLNNEVVTVENDGPREGCDQSTSFDVNLSSASAWAGVLVEVEKCDGSVDRHRLMVSTHWILETVLFPDVTAGESICRPFRIKLGYGGIRGAQRGSGIVVESITSSDDRLSFDFSSPFPITVRSGSTFRYNVCFAADKPGLYKIPVTVWVRRDQPSGGHTTYPVADTAVVRVLPGVPEVEIELVEFEEMLEVEEEEPTISSFGTTEESHSSAMGTSPQTGEETTGGAVGIE